MFSTVNKGHEPPSVGENVSATEENKDQQQERQDDNTEILIRVKEEEEPIISKSHILLCCSLFCCPQMIIHLGYYNIIIEKIFLSHSPVTSHVLESQ